jgi:hypothetical protein
VNEDIVIPLAGIVMIIVLSLGIPLVRAYVRRMELAAKQPGLPSGVEQRLERMEQAIDAVAVEVERISEGQRFTTKLLSENARGEQKLPAAPEPSSVQRN